MAKVRIVPGSDQSLTVETSVRKISNGWITRTSRYGGSGGYESKEIFSEAKPKIDLEMKPKSKSKPARANPLVRAGAKPR